MHPGIRFRLNERLYELHENSGILVLDWLRKEQGLTGTKEGCREGDCGACLVLLGERPAKAKRPGAVEWIPVASCLLALGELDGRHLITVEGLATKGPTPVMNEMHNENASQCGFCSPGIVIALTARLLEGGNVDDAALASALEGNLCRCTGYGAIRRASSRIAADYTNLPLDFDARLAALASRGVIPPSLAALMTDLPEPMGRKHRSRALSPAHVQSGEPMERTLGGGTDWFVRHPDPETDQENDFTECEKKLRSIQLGGSVLEIGAATTVREFFANTEVRAIALGRGSAAGIESYEADVASPPIRARATLAGNIANASPVADMTAMLFALDARLRLGVRPGSEPAGTTRSEDLHREIALTDFFIGYKKTAARADERIEAILLPQADQARLFSFEKAARRARLDIAAVNTAFSCRLANGDGSGKNQGDGRGEGKKNPGEKTSSSKAFTRENPPVLHDVRLSAGGVGPTPLLLKEASAYLEGKPVTAANVRECALLAVTGTKPISDARGTAAYRSDILERLVMAHFLRLFPELSLEEELFA